MKRSPARPWALVTGASKGIGAACAIELATTGFDVVIGYRHDRDAAEATAAHARTRGAEATVVQLDIADGAAVERAVSVAARAEPLTCVVANASGLTDVQQTHTARSALDLDREAFRHHFECRAIGLLALVNAALPGLRPNRGSVIVVTSTGTNRYIPGYAALAAAMAASDALVRYLACELAPEIRVNGVKAGLVDTAAVHHLTDNPERLKRYVASHTPMARIAEPEDVAGAVAFLASDAARWITGQVVVTDGGHQLV